MRWIPNRSVPVYAPPSDDGFTNWIERFRDPAFLGEFAQYRYAVCAFDASSAEFGHDSIAEVLRYARDKWGEDYASHCSIMKKPYQGREPG